MTYAYVPAYAQYGKRKGPVRAFIVHMAEGGGTVGFLSRPNERGVSVHYIVQYTGVVVQMVKESDASGSINPKDLRTGDDADGFYGIASAKAVMGDWWDDPNSAAITCEIEGYASAGPTEKQNAALIRLVEDVRSRFPGIGLLGHRDFQSYKACPGKHIPWDRLGGHGPANDEVDMPGLRLVDLERYAGAVTVVGDKHAAVQISDRELVYLPAGASKEAVAKGRLDPPLDAQLGNPPVAGDRATVYVIGAEAAVLLAADVKPEPIVAPIPNCDAAVKTEHDRVKAAAVAAVEGIE